MRRLLPILLIAAVSCAAPGTRRDERIEFDTRAWAPPVAHGWRGPRLPDVVLRYEERSEEACLGLEIFCVRWPTRRELIDPDTYTLELSGPTGAEVAFEVDSRRWVRPVEGWFPPGDYQLDARSDAGEILAAYPFTVSEVGNYDGPHPLAEPGYDRVYGLTLESDADLLHLAHTAGLASDIRDRLLLRLDDAEAEQPRLRVYGPLSEEGFCLLHTAPIVHGDRLTFAGGGMVPMVVEPPIDLIEPELLIAPGPDGSTLDVVEVEGRFSNDQLMQSSLTAQLVEGDCGYRMGVHNCTPCEPGGSGQDCLTFEVMRGSAVELAPALLPVLDEAEPCDPAGTVTSGVSWCSSIGAGSSGWWLLVALAGLGRRRFGVSRCRGAHLGR